MKKNSSITLSSIALLLLALGSASLRAEDAPRAVKVEGTYHGSVVSSGMLTPVVTHFKTDGNGVISGEYVMQEDENSEEHGTLTDFKWEGQHVLICTWKDKYGTGTLRLLFAPDMSLFRGLWGPDAEQTNLIWDGTRTGAPAKSENQEGAGEARPGTGLSISNPTA